MAAEVEIIFKKSSALSLEARKSGNQLYGQKNHDKNVHKEVLRLYGKSVAFAVEDEELALAYGNRSALLLHLKEYEKCLIDIDRALKLTSSVELKSKLESRKAKCIDAIKSSRDTIASVNEELKNVSISENNQSNLPNFTPSSNIQSASEAVSAKYNEKFGRHMVATRDIRPGEVVIAERAYVYFPIIAKRHLICSHCLSFAWNGVPCDHCAFAMYCSEACKKDAWREYHDVECSLFLTITLPLSEEEDYLPFLLKAVRLLIKAVKSEGIDAVIGEFFKANSENCKGIDGLMVEGKLRSDTFRSCINLLSLQYADEIPLYKSMIPHLVDTLYHRTSLFNSAESKIDDSEKIISQLKILLKKLASIIDCNGFQYQVFVCECEGNFECDSNLECDARRGGFLAPFSSLINHSCSANVKRMCLPSGELMWFTIAPVKKGEQLYASYGVTCTEEKEDRQRLLQMYYQFTCKCRVCEENWPTDQGQVETKFGETMTYVMIRSEFERCFPSVARSPCMNLPDDWVFDEETLEHAVKLSELTYKYFDNAMIAAFQNEHYENYIFEAFRVLYGEKFAIPDNCL